MFMTINSGEKVIRNASGKSDGHIFLANPDGYWLIGPEPTQEWGFMFEEGTANGWKPKCWKIFRI